MRIGRLLVHEIELEGMADAWQDALVALQQQNEIQHDILRRLCEEWPDSTMWTPSPIRIREDCGAFPGISGSSVAASCVARSWAPKIDSEVLSHPQPRPSNSTSESLCSECTGS